MMPFNPLGPLLPWPLIQQPRQPKPAKPKHRAPAEKAQRKAEKQAREQALAKLLVRHDLLAHNQEEAARIAHSMRKSPMLFVLYGLMHMVKELQPQQPYSELVDEEEALQALLLELQTLREQTANREDHPD